jgi:hypothetical protein
VTSKSNDSSPKKLKFRSLTRFIVITFFNGYHCEQKIFSLPLNYELAKYSQFTVLALSWLHIVLHHLPTDNPTSGVFLGKVKNNCNFNKLFIVLFLQHSLRDHSPLYLPSTRYFYSFTPQPRLTKLPTVVCFNQFSLNVIVLVPFVE